MRETVRSAELRASEHETSRLPGVLWPRRRGAIGSASGGRSSAAERFPAVLVASAPEVRLPPLSLPPPRGCARRSSDRLRTRGVSAKWSQCSLQATLQFGLWPSADSATWSLVSCWSALLFVTGYAVILVSPEVAYLCSVAQIMADQILVARLWGHPPRKRLPWSWLTVILPLTGDAHGMNVWP